MAPSPLVRFQERLARIPDGRLLTGLFVFALLIRLIYLAEIRHTDFCAILVGDGLVYDEWARRIQGDWIGTEVFYQAPLYPYFLAAVYSIFGHDPMAVRLIQCLLGALSCVLAALAGRAFLSRRTGLGAGLLLAVYAPAIFFDGLIQKASLDLFFMTLLLCVLGKISRNGPKRWPLMAGAALGLLTLTRENALLLFPLLLAWLIWVHRKEKLEGALRAGVLFALGLVLAISPVTLRNAKVGGEFVVTTSQFGPNFFIGNNAAADGTYRPLRWGHGSALLERQDATEIAEQWHGRRLTPREVSDFWWTCASEWIRTHPVDWLKLMGRKWMLVWNHRELADSDEPLVYEDSSLTLALAGFVFSFGTIAPLALAGIVATWSERGRLVPLYLALFGIAAGTALFFVFARYRFSMVPILALFAAAGIGRIVELAAARKTGPLFGYALLIAASGILVHWNLNPDQHPRAMAYYNVAVSLERAGNRSRAIPYYRRALESTPGFVQARVNLGVLLAMEGKLDEAIACQREALRLRPGDAAAHCNLANVLAAKGDLAGAEKHYRAALQIEPELPQAAQGLATVLEKKKEPAKKRK